MMDFDVPAEDEIGIPDGTTAIVTAIPDRDGEIANARKTKNGRDVISIQFEIVEGPHAGRRCSLSLWPSATDMGFRKRFEALTGIDLSAGGKVSLPGDIITALQQNSYEVKLGKQENQQTGRVYTVVTFIAGRSERIEPAAAPEISISSGPATASEAVAAVDEEDVPF